VGGGEAQEAACGGSKVAMHAILSRLPDPVLAVRLQDCKVSTFGRALHHTWTKRRQRAGNFLRAAVVFCGCDVPRMAVFCRENRPLYIQIQNKCSTSGVPELHSPTSIIP